MWIPYLVDSEVKQYVKTKRDKLWKAYETLILSTVRESLPLGLREFENYYTELLVKVVSKKFAFRSPENRAAENFGEWLKEFVKQTVENALQHGQLGDEALFSEEVKIFVRGKRQELWDAHKELLVPIVQKALPPDAREFETYYTDLLLRLVLRRFTTKFPESRPNFEEWLKELGKQVVEESTPNLTNDSGELRDEELVSLSRSGFPKCKILLLECYQAKLRPLTSAIVNAKGICPKSEDAVEFAKDVAQEVSLKLLTEVDSYRFQSSFGTWVSAICENEAYSQQRKVLGRSKDGKRQYLSFEELQERSASSPVIQNLARREILHKILGKHRLQGPRALKSTRAIELRHFEDMDTTDIAQVLRTSRAYVDQLFSHDYPQLRKICLEDFGLSGTDL